MWIFQPTKPRSVMKMTDNMNVSSNELTQEYISIIKQDKNDEENRRESWNYILGSSAVWDGQPVYIDYIPRLYSSATYEFLKTKVEMLYDILSKIIREYQNSPNYRELFYFDERLVPLMCADTGYTESLPIARLDCFHNEETNTLKFCEFNTDGTSGMNENREALNAIRQSEPYKKFSEQHNISNFDQELFDGWVDEFLKIYSKHNASVEKPNIAIVDFLENAAFEEFKIYGQLFQKRGYNFSVFDVRELAYDGKHLFGKNAAWGESNCNIDVIWRRSVASDLLAHWEESQSYVNSILEQKVVLIGGFSTNIVHDKQVFRVMRAPETLDLLTKEEKELVFECIPFTAFLDSDEVDLNDVKSNPGKWVIKPTDGYCSRGVVVGRDYVSCFRSRELWEKLIDEFLTKTRKQNQHFLVQENCELYQTPSIALYGDEKDYVEEPKKYNNLTGLYLMGGKFSGIFTRKGPGSIILGREGGITAASLVVTE